jgi:hypothetical protein
MCTIFEHNWDSAKDMDVVMVLKRGATLVLLFILESGYEYCSVLLGFLQI